MINVISERALAVASRKTACGFFRGLAALLAAVCLGVILLWRADTTHAGGSSANLTLHATGGSASAFVVRGRIAFARGTHVRSDIFVLNPDDTAPEVRLTDGTSLNVEPAWSPDGTKIAFTSARDGNYEVYVMNADGTGQTNLTRNPLPDTSPAWSPDGTRIAFVGFVEGRGYQIHVMNADGTGRRSLSGDRGGEREPAWSPDGTRLAFTRDSGVHLMNADDGGGVRKLVDGFAPAWSPSGARVAFVSRGWPSTSGETIRVVNEDGTGERVVAVPPGRTTGPSWSPDGSEVIYDAADYALFRIEVDGCRALRQVLHTSRPDRQPAWQWPPAIFAPVPAPTPCPASSPTPTPPPRASDRVLFTSLRDGNHEIYVMNGDGSNQTNLTNNPAQDASPVWSPDGTRIAFTSDRPGPTNPHGLSNIFVMNADGSGVRQVTDNGREGSLGVSRLYDPAWSPDGTKLVYVNSFMGELSNLVVVNADGGGGATFIESTEAADPAWSPDGTRIAFVGREGVSNPEDAVGARYLFVVNADGSGKTRVAPMPSLFDSFGYPPQASGPTWSPDGKRIAYASNLFGNDEIFAVGATGGMLTPLTDHPAQDLMPAWLPDGSGIAFTSYRDGQQRDVYVMNADGTQPARLTSHPADDFDADWRSAQAPPRPAAESTVQFRSPSFRIRETGPYGDTITVTRLGDLSREATVDFATAELCPPTVACDGAARDRSDYVRASGTLRFAPGEASRTIDITVIDDVKVEPDEFFLIRLSNAAGASLGAQSDAGIVITSDDTNPSAQNPIDTPHFFVRMHYLDFLGREPESTGLQAWLDVLARCPNVFNLDRDSPSALCDRIHVSSSFFRSPEFAENGYFIYLLYKVGLGRPPTYDEFVRALKFLTTPTPGTNIISKKDSLVLGFMAQAEFMELYRDTATPEAFVDRLLQIAGLTLTGDVTRDTLVEDLRAGRKSRAHVLSAVAEHPDARAKEFNGAFVTMQYFGYLKRDPEETGYNAWLKYLNANPTDFRTMIHGFLNSQEYRSRFGSP